MSPAPLIRAPMDAPRIPSVRPWRPTTVVRLCHAAARTAGGVAVRAWRGAIQKPVPVRALVKLDVPVWPSPNGGVRTRKAAAIVGAPAALRVAMDAHQSTPIQPPDGLVARIAGAVLSAGVVQAPDGTVIAESLINTEGSRQFGRFTRAANGHLLQTRSPILHRFRGAPHVLIKQAYDRNYGHWLVETLPRLALVEDHFALGDLKYIVSGYHGPMQPIYEDSLALYGIRRDQIVEAGRETIHVDDLIYPTPITRHPWHFAPRCVEVLEQLAMRVAPHPSGFERIYVSRNRAEARHLLNEPTIVAIAERHGFAFVEPETLTLYQQMALFRSARVIVGSYGAALTNAMFATNDVTLFALTTPFMQDDFFSTLMSLKGGRYLSQHGTTSNPAPDSHADFHGDPATFEQILRSIL